MFAEATITEPLLKELESLLQRIADAGVDTGWVHQTVDQWAEKLDEEETPFRCDQCEALMIDGHFCHETGCPNARKTWVEDRNAWVLYLPCFICGCDVEEGEACDCQDVDPDEDNCPVCDEMLANCECSEDKER